MRTLVAGGCVYTADPDHRVIPDGAVLIDGDRIVAVGTRAEIEAGLPADQPAPTLVDATASLVLPGLVNPHWHDLSALRLPFNGALRPATDRDDRPAFMALGGDVARISVTFDKFTDTVDQLRPDEADAIARHAVWSQLRTGVTTLGDVGSINRPESLAAAAAALGIRCVVTTWAGDTVCAPGETRSRRTRDTDTVLDRIDQLLTSTAADRSGLIRARPTAVYAPNMSDELIRGYAELTARHDVGFTTHVAALRHEAALTRAYHGSTPVRRFADHGLLSERFMAVHCAFADADDTKLLIDAGAHISHSPAKYGTTGEASLTETRAIPELRRAGLPVSLSTDGGALPVGGMLEAMRAAWQAYNEMYADPTEVRATDALAMASSVAAAGLGWDDQVGSLQPGKQADLVIIPTDDWRYLLNPRPLEALLTLGGSTDVDTVIVAGRTVVRHGRPTTADPEQIEADYLDALTSFSIRALRLDPTLVHTTVDRARRHHPPAGRAR